MYSSSISAPAGRAVAATNRVLRNAYLLLGLTLLPTIAGAFLGMAFPLTGWLSLIVFMAGLFGFQFMVIKNRNSAAGIGWLLAFTLFMGYMIGPMLGMVVGLRNGFEIVAMAAGGTAAIFFVMAGYAATTKRDFTSPSLMKMMVIGMWMAFGLGLVGWVIQIPALSLAVSSVFIPIAAMFILITINRTVRGGETNYIMVTMTLFIMLFNIFQSLLHLLMAFAGNRE